jgi:capsular polysaccharide biosynthesis protein
MLQHFFSFFAGGVPSPHHHEEVVSHLQRKKTAKKLHTFVTISTASTNQLPLTPAPLFILGI